MGTYLQQVRPHLPAERGNEECPHFFAMSPRGGTGRGVRCVSWQFGVLTMRISFELAAEFRDGQGKGASRRLRHSGKVPAILYGGHVEPRAISLDHQKLMTLIDNEKFYSSIINLKVGDKTQ